MLKNESKNGEPTLSRQIQVKPEAESCLREITGGGYYPQKYLEEASTEGIRKQELSDGDRICVELWSEFALCHSIPSNLRNPRRGFLQNALGW